MGVWKCAVLVEVSTRLPSSTGSSILDIIIGPQYYIKVEWQYTSLECVLESVNIVEMWGRTKIEDKIYVYIIYTHIGHIGWGCIEDDCPS